MDHRKSRMDRRQFLGAATGTLAGAGAIGWLSHYFLGEPAWAGDDESAKAIAAMGDVSDAYRRAHGLGKPLLVLVIPEKDEKKHERGDIFGALLNHGGPPVYADLALCELVCAAVADVKLQLKDVKVEGEPLMLLVETGGAVARATPIDPQIPQDEPVAGKRGGDREKLEAFVKERLDKVAAALRAAVAPDGKALAERAALAEARLPADEAKALRDALAAGRPVQPGQLDRGAAVARAMAENPEAPRPQLLEEVVAVAKKRVTGAPPAGAKWARSGGCGLTIEGEGAGGVIVGCGMGYVPKLSERFLWFFTQ